MVVPNAPNTKSVPSQTKMFLTPGYRSPGPRASGIPLLVTLLSTNTRQPRTAQFAAWLLRYYFLLLEYGPAVQTKGSTMRPVAGPQVRSQSLSYLTSDSRVAGSPIISAYPSSAHLVAVILLGSGPLGLITDGPFQALSIRCIVSEE